MTDDGMIEVFWRWRSLVWGRVQVALRRRMDGVRGDTRHVNDQNNNLNLPPVRGLGK